MTKIKKGTLAYVFSDNKVLLGTKKYGNAKGKLNGFGGKIEETDKNIYEAVKREVYEETNLKITDPPLHGVLIFNHKNKREKNVVYIFKIKNFKGRIKESDEMSVQWVEVGSIPRNKMWDSDKYWFDYILEDRKFEIELVFNSEDSLCDELHIKFVNNINKFL